MQLPAHDIPLGDSDELEAHVAMLDLCTDLMGSCHPQTLATAKRLGIAFWRAGYIDQAIGLLDEALTRLTTSLGNEHPDRIDLLCTLGEIFLDQRHLEQSGVVFREVVECCTRRNGANHPSVLAAKGDLAIVLFELGEEQEAISLEQEAYEKARTHLKMTHPVTCVLAWNRALRCKKHGDASSAREIIINELVWLLAEDQATLGADQNTIRTMLVAELNWDSAKIC